MGASGQPPTCERLRFARSKQSELSIGHTTRGAALHPAAASTSTTMGLPEKTSTPVTVLPVFNNSRIRFGFCMRSHYSMDRILWLTVLPAACTSFASVWRSNCGYGLIAIQTPIECKRHVKAAESRH